MKISKLIEERKNLSGYLDRLSFGFEQKVNDSLRQVQQFELAVGHFCAYSVSGTCGLSTVSALIGFCDDPRYFSHPERYNAGILWFAHGEIEYNLPSFMFENTSKISELEISIELCSEAHGINENFLSDIYFSINDLTIGKWVSPGDFGKLKGTYTPKWWYLTEYGKTCYHKDYFNWNLY